MTDITIEKTHEDSGSRALAVTVPEDRVRKAEDRVVHQLAGRVRVSGFRKGKVPTAVVRKRFGDAVRQTVLEELVKESWEQIQSEEEMPDVIDRRIRNLQVPESGPIQFEFLIEFKPKLTLARTGGFALQREVAPVTDDQVEEQLLRVREQKATWLPAGDVHPALGDLVRVEVTPLDESGGSEAKPYSFVLGEGKAIPALEERIMALVPGETAESEVPFPEDHPDESKRGQSRRLRVTLHEVKRQDLPALDDALAREVGDFETVDDLRAAVRKDLAASAERDADAKVRDQLIQQVVEANQVEAPQAMVGRVLRAYAEAYGIPPEQEQRFAQEFGPLAVAQVRRQLVIEAVAEAEGLAATEADLDARIQEIAAAREVPAGEVYATLQKSQRLGEIERALTEEKVFAHLLAQSTLDEATT